MSLYYLLSPFDKQTHTPTYDLFPLGALFGPVHRALHNKFHGQRLAS